MGFLFTRFKSLFNLWGYLKDHVYQDNLRTIENLKAIQTVAEKIPTATLREVVCNFRGRWI